MSRNQSSSPTTTPIIPVHPSAPLKRIKRRKIPTSNPIELFKGDINPTTNLKNICNETSYHNISCQSLTQGGFGAIEKCTLKCGDTEIIQSDVIQKKYTTAKPEKDIELDFMIKYCSDGKYKENFAQLLFWNNKSNNLFLGLKQYTCSLHYDEKNTVMKELFRTNDDWNEYINNNIIDIHKKVIKNLHKIHKLQYAHLDIKPGNIFININIKDYKLEEVVLGDFGLIRHYTDANIRDTSEGTPWLMLPEPDSTITYILEEFAKFRDNWAWALSLCYLLKYYEQKITDSKNKNITTIINENIFTWIQYINDPTTNSWFFLAQISKFVTDKDLHKDTKAYLRGKRNLNPQHKKIINFIIDQINMLPTFYKSTTNSHSVLRLSELSFSMQSPSTQSLSVKSNQHLNKTKLMASIRSNYKPRE